MDKLASLGASLFLVALSFVTLPRLPQGYHNLVRQLYFVGFLSLPIIIICSFFTGIVLALQGYEILVKFGSEGSLGVLVSLTVLRELGPVLSALLFAGRAGSAIASELGMMKASQQLDALKLMGVNDLHRVVAPRFVAGLLSLPLLIMIFDAVAIWGGAWFASSFLGVYDIDLWSVTREAVESGDIVQSFVKGIGFAFVISWISIFYGYTCKPTPEGVSYATTQTVVLSSVFILFFDFLFTALFF